MRCARNPPASRCRAAVSRNGPFSQRVPSYRQRFRSDTTTATRERFYRLVRACCAMVEQLREPFEGALELDETTFGGTRKSKRG